jgi:cytochrome c
MIAFPIRRRSLAAALSSAALALVVAATTAPATDQVPTDQELLESKCSICHSAHRIYRLTPDQIKPVLERMRKMNPDWMTDAQSEHVAKAIETMLGDKNVAAEREAWFDAVDRGQALFNDPKLGTTGKSCASCHPVASLRNVADSFPKFDPVRKRFVDIDEAINFMIQERLKGKPLPPNDQKYFDLLAYLKTLK